MVLTFVPSSHTSWLGVKEWEEVKGPFIFMILKATCKAAETSVRSWSMVLSHSSTESIWDVVETGGRNSG